MFKTSTQDITTVMGQKHILKEGHVSLHFQRDKYTHMYTLSLTPSNHDALIN